MAITAAMVKELRELTGAGMMDCKKALGETDGNMDEAVEYLRKNGQAKAEKKASRIAAEGLCTVVVKDALEEKVAVIGENLKIRRFEKVVATNGCVVSYVHGGGRIGVIVEAETAVVNDAVKEALTNLAMQIAALNPKYVSRDEISEEYIAHEKEILLAQIMNDPKESQKPEKVINGMIEGRVSKELKEICLVDQVYVKAEDGKQTVAKYLEEVSKAVGTPVSVKRFVRFETGEGIEKKQEDFAAEVAAQMNA